LQRLMGLLQPNNTINVHYAKRNQHLSKRVHLAKRDNLAKDLYIFNYVQNPWLFIGINVEPIPEALAKLFNLEAGMVILEIRDKSIAAVNNLEAGDIIISINGLPTTSERTLTDALHKGLQQQPMKVLLCRGSQRMTKMIDLTNNLSGSAAHSDEVFIIGPDVFDSELFGYTRDKINSILRKSRAEIEKDIDRLEEEIYQLRTRMGVDR